MIVKAVCPCCGKAYFVNFEVQISKESEKLLSITQTEITNESKIIHDLSSAISMRNGIDVENLTEVLNREFRIALDSIPAIIDSIVESLGMYQENNKLYFKK